MRALIIPYTLYPTAEQYVTVCTKLIEKHLKLRDMIGYGIVSSCPFVFKHKYMTKRPSSDPRQLPSKKTKLTDVAQTTYIYNTPIRIFSHFLGKKPNGLRGL